MFCPLSGSFVRESRRSEALKGMPRSAREEEAGTGFTLLSL
jgi:hypothetical protein